MCTLKTSSRYSKAFITGIALLAGSVCFSQSASWANKDLFEQKVFIDNKEGQFDGLNNNKGAIRFGTRVNGVDLYFSSTGIVYRHDEVIVKKEEEAKGKEAEHIIKPHYFSVEWEGCNPTTTIIPEEEVSFYYTYPKGADGTIKEQAYRKILYKNLYPHIDVEYFFPTDKKGIEYSVIVHPGGDLSKVRLKYPDAISVNKNSHGDIEMESSFGLFTDHAPAKTYYEDDNSITASSFLQKGNEVSFNAGNYNHNKTLVIDPWPTNPGFSYNSAYDLDFDYAGNVYAYGSYNHFQLIKMNSAGVLLWTYTASTLIGTWYGDMTVDKKTGTSYIAEGYSGGAGSGAKVQKINTGGSLTATFPGVSGYSLEIWRMEFDMCNRTIVAGDGANNTYQASIIDTNMSSQTAVNVLATGNNWHDVAILALDPQQDTAYMAFSERIGDPTFNNVMARCPSTLASTQYIVSDGYNFVETQNVSYIGNILGNTNGYNGMVVSYNWVYMYNGSIVKRASKQSGAIVKTMNLGDTSMHFRWGGMDVDGCDNLYVGKVDTMYIFNSAFAQVGNIVLPDTVYDLHIDELNKRVYACGKGFVTSNPYTFTNPPSLTTTTTPAGCSTNNGTATAHFTLCGNPAAINYSWSNGTTGQTDTGLASGTYTVTVTLGCVATYTATATVGNLGNKLPVVITGSSPICAGSNDTLVATAGSGYTYLWNNGATTSSIIVHPAVNTTYSVVVNNGTCTGDTNLSIAVITGPPITVTATTTNLCKGDSVILSASGATSYVWNTGATTASIKVAPGSTTTYTVVGSNGKCPSDSTITIVVNVTPNLVVTGNKGICYGSSTTLTASGGEQYKWIPPTGLDCDSCATVVADPTKTTTYTVIAYNGNCSDTVLTKVTVSLQPKGSACCSDTIQMGDTATLTTLDSNAISYFWSPPLYLTCTDCPSTKAFPEFSTTYTVVMTDSSGCPIIDSVRIYVEGCSTVWIPDAFSPNRDGLNETFGPKGICMVGYTMSIFDRWGNMIYSTDSSQPWDGTYKENGKRVQEDTYVYFIIVTDGFLKTHKYRGKVTVLK